VLAGAGGAEVEQLHEVGDAWRLREVADHDGFAGGVVVVGVVRVVGDPPAEVYAIAQLVSGTIADTVTVIGRATVTPTPAGRLV